MKRLRKDWRHLDVEMVVRESAAVVLGGSTLHAGKLTQCEISYYLTICITTGFPRFCVLGRN